MADERMVAGKRTLADNRRKGTARGRRRPPDGRKKHLQTTGKRTLPGRTRTREVSLLAVQGMLPVWMPVRRLSN